jgi:hypothetical protein
MQIPIKIPTGSIQEIEYFTFSYIHGPWLFILWFHCGFCNKKGKFRVLNGFSHLQTSTNKITIVKNQKLATKNFLFKTWSWSYSRCFATPTNLHWKCESYRNSFGLFFFLFFFWLFSNQYTCRNYWLYIIIFLIAP